MKQRRQRGVPYFHAGAAQQMARRAGLGNAKKETMLNREAVAAVVSYCFVAAAHDILNYTAKDATDLTVGMNARAETYEMARRNVGVKRAREWLAGQTARLLDDDFILPAGDLLKRKNGQMILAERRDAAYMVVQFGIGALNAMKATPDQIGDVVAETRNNYAQFLEWAEDGEWVAYERLRRVVADIYEVDATVEQVSGEKPIFGKEF